MDGEHFLLTYGDGVSDLNIRTLVDYHILHGRMGTVTAVTPPGRFGELKIENGCVVEFQEKPPATQGLISGGFFVFNRSLWIGCRIATIWSWNASRLRNLGPGRTASGLCT